VKKEWKNPLLYLFSKKWQYSDDKGRIVCFWGMFILAEIIETFVSPLVIASIINKAQNEGVNSSNINAYYEQLSLLVLAIICAWALHGPARVMERTSGFKATTNYTKYLLGGVIKLPMEWHVDHHSGDTIDKVKKGADAIKDFSDSSFVIIYAIVRLISAYYMLVYFSPSAAYIVIIMIIVTVFITTKFDKILVKQYDEINALENKVSEGIFDSISNITTIIVLRVEQIYLNLMYEKIDAAYEISKKNYKLNEIKWFLVQLSCSVMTVLVLVAYFHDISSKGKTVVIGSLFLLIKYLDQISNLFFQFAAQYGNIQKQRARINNSEKLSVDFKNRSLKNHTLAENWRTLEIKNLNFTYSGGKEGRIHIDNVNLDIVRGQKIAFVGKRGSGKTTLLKLIRDLYHPQSLTLTVDGVEIIDGFAGIERAIALVPQMPEVFSTTVGENITLGEKVDHDEIQKFTDMACFTEVIPSLPKGLSSATKEKGVNLSGGQQQCLALARGLLASRGREILLLDEPTSSLDKATEKTIYGNILKNFPDKTVISTVHGLHLLPLFDVIYVFDEGRIVGRGTVDELLTTCPEFQTLWRAMENVAS
jgi:ATP-binding cassette subfamily B protein